MVWEQFCQIAQSYPERSCLELEDRVYTYGEVHQLAKRLACEFRDGCGAAFTGKTAMPSGPLGVFAAVDPLTYAGMLAAFALERAYIPLSRKVPAESVAAVIHAAGIEHLLVCEQTVEHACATLSQIQHSVAVVLPESIWANPNCVHLRAHHPQHRYLMFGGETFSDAELDPRSASDAESVAYVIHTSGSTGPQKGVPITHANLNAYLRALDQVLPFTHTDRCSQANDLCFDLSVHDVLSCWLNGATLVPIPERYRAAPYQYLRKAGLTVWLSTAHVAAQMFRTAGTHAPDLPSLRIVIQAGEAFPLELAERWRAASPRSQIWNFYGPAEGTIAVCGYRFADGDSDPQQTGYLPIGSPFPGVEVRIEPFGDDADPTRGELLISGPQVFRGYLGVRGELPSDSPEAPVPRPHWYATGDIVRRLESGALLFCGRSDRAVKVRGYRVDPLNVEDAARRLALFADVAALAITLDRTVRLVLCVVPGSETFEPSDALRAVNSTLPTYMQASSVIDFQEFPLTGTGKVDYPALTKAVVERMQSQAAR
ncbi:MAG: AMP-binding protein [Bdellovibrionota bacterium]